MAPIGNDGQQDVIAGLGGSLALLDRLDPRVEHLLIGLEQCRRLGSHDLPPAGRDVGHLHVLPQVIRHHHIGKRAEHGDQLRHVDKGCEAADRLVFAGWLDLQFRSCIAEAGCPGIEFVQPTLGKRRMTEQALDGKHLAQRIRDRRTGRQHQRAARVLRFDVAGLHIEIPGPLRSIRIDALQRRHIGGERQLAEFLRLVDDDLVDADFRNSQQVILAGRQAFEPLLKTFLQPL